MLSICRLILKSHIHSTTDGPHKSIQKLFIIINYVCSLMYTLIKSEVLLRNYFSLVWFKNTDEVLYTPVQVELEAFF